MLDFDPEKVERLADAESVSLADYPDHWHTLGTDGSPIDLRLSYVYDPHDPNDGVTVHVPLKVLSRLTPEQFTWNVPGLLDELIVGMIKSLPKTLRVQFVPALIRLVRFVRGLMRGIRICLVPVASRSRILLLPMRRVWPRGRICLIRSRRRQSASLARRFTLKC